MNHCNTYASSITLKKIHLCSLISSAIWSIKQILKLRRRTDSALSLWSLQFGRWITSEHWYQISRPQHGHLKLNVCHFSFWNCAFLHRLKTVIGNMLFIILRRCMRRRNSTNCPKCQKSQDQIGTYKQTQQRFRNSSKYIIYENHLYMDMSFICMKPTGREMQFILMFSTHQTLGIHITITYTIEYEECIYLIQCEPIS